MKKRNSSINEIVLNPLYITNKEFEILKIQGLKYDGWKKTKVVIKIFLH